MQKNQEMKGRGEIWKKIENILPVNISISDFNIFSSKLRDKFPKNKVAADFPTEGREGKGRKKNEMKLNQNNLQNNNNNLYNFISNLCTSIPFDSIKIKWNQMTWNHISFTQSAW